MRIIAKTKWYQAGLRFECTRCGNCCSGDPGYVWATKEEIDGISTFLGPLQADGIDKKHFRRVGLHYSLNEKPNGDCIFLSREDGKTGCAIYPVRPLQCRTWPFWPQNLRSPDAWNNSHKKCPGINTGKHYDFVQIESRRTQKSWKGAPSREL